MAENSVYVEDLKEFIDTEDVTTIVKAAKFAIAIQNAANYRGVMREFKREYADVLHKWYPYGKWLNHPITRLVFAKTEDLRGHQTGEIHRQDKYLGGNPTSMDSFATWDGVNDATLDTDIEVRFYDDPSTTMLYGSYLTIVEQIANLK